MKTICLDLRALQIGHQNRGIGMHIKSVIENLPPNDARYIFYCFDKSDPIKDLGISTKANYTLVQTPTVNTTLDSPKNVFGIFKLVWHQFSHLRPYHPDIFLQFDFMLGTPRWRGIKNVVIGYDLIPLMMKNEYMPSMVYAWNHTFGKKAKIRALLRSLYYRFRYRIHYAVYKRADKIVCISQASADSFHNLLKIKRSKLIVSHLAAVAVNVKPDMKILDQIDKPYIFYIGGTDSRKSLRDIVYAYNIIRGRGTEIGLILAGKEFQTLEQLPDVLGRNAIMESPYRKDIHLVGFISDEEKVGLYKNALSFVFTSSFEGFGLPVIEAMSASCPVIAYRNSSIPEVAGDAAILVKTGDYGAIASELTKLAHNEKLRRKLVSAGLEQSAKFTWEKHIKSLERALLGF